jgi:hypothetical protein
MFQTSSFTGAKRVFFCISVGCLMLALCTSGFSQRQPHRGRMNVPFDFILNGTRFPAGQYTWEDVLPSHALLRGPDGKPQALYFNYTAEAVKSPRAVFAVRFKQYWFVGMLWIGKMQYTGFNPHGDDGMTDIAITPLD